MKKFDIKKFINKNGIQIFLFLNTIVIGIISVQVVQNFNAVQSLENTTSHLITLQNLRLELFEDSDSFDHLENIQTIADQNDFSQLFVELYSAIGLHNLQILSIEVTEPRTRTADIVYNTILLTATGRVQNLLNYIEFVTNMDNLLIIDSVRIDFPVPARTNPTAEIVIFVPQVVVEQ